MKVDAAVIGAGPAGAMAARELARRGARVLLVEKRPIGRGKVCGGCLNPAALEVLVRVGLGGLAEHLGGRRLEAMVLACEGRRARFGLGGVAVSRGRLDAALVEAAAEAGAAVRAGVSGRVAKGREAESGTCEVVLGGGDRSAEGERSRGEQRVEARVVLVADGVGGSALRGWEDWRAEVQTGARVGLGAVGEASEADAVEPGVVYMGCGRAGYVGMVRVEQDLLDVAAAADLAFIREAGGPAKAVMKLMREAGLSAVAGLEAWRWGGTGALTRQRRPRAKAGVFVLGDAAGYVEPFTGEGIAWALGSGEAVADVAMRAMNGWDERIEREWERRHARLAGWRQRRCGWIAAGLRRRWVVRGAVGAARVWPGVGQRVTQGLGGAGVGGGSASLK